MKKLNIYSKTSAKEIIDEINVPCDYTFEEYKFGRKVVKTLTGKSQEKYISTFKRFNVIYSFLSEVNYNKLLKIWKATNDTFIMVENGQEYNVIITDDEINFKCIYSKEKNENYYSGSINLDETY